MHYTGQVYRHPIEGNTPLLEVTAGCSHNKCSFCTMYQNTPFSLSPLSHIEEDLQELASSNQNINRVFLVNGEPFILSTEKLVEIGKLIGKYLPNIETITCYASVKSLKSKSVEELKLLRSLKFNQLHVGLESAYDPALLQMNKGFTQDEAYENLKKLQEAKIEWDAIVMLGVAGKGKGQEHIAQTSALINEFPPYLLSIMTTAVSTGTPLEVMRDQGTFVECSEGEMILEEIDLLEKINVEEAYFFGGHSYNLIPVNAPLSRKSEIIEHLKQKYAVLDQKTLNSAVKRANI
ncbi:MAG: radical SAM protein [Eubacteriales bacterium]